MYEIAVYLGYCSGGYGGIRVILLGMLAGEGEIDGGLVIMAIWTNPFYSKCFLCGVSRIMDLGGDTLDVVSLLLADAPFEGVRQFWLSTRLFSVDAESIRVLSQFRGYMGKLLCGQCVTVIERDYVIGLEYDSLPLYIDGRLVCESSRELVIRRLRSGV